MPFASARARTHPTNDNTSHPDYVYALAAANHFMHAWQTGDTENGMIELSDGLRHSQNADNLEEHNVDVVNYFNNIDTMITHFRADVGIESLPLIQSDYPVLAGKDTNANYAINGPYAPSIRVLMRNNAKIPLLIKNAVLIPTDSLTMYTADGLYTHYNHNGDFKWANRVADSICARNWGPANLCGATPAFPAIRSPSIHGTSPLSYAVFFDGRNGSAFDKAGKSFEMFLPSGRVVRNATGDRLRNENLRPGIYIIRNVADK